MLTGLSTTIAHIIITVTDELLGVVRACQGYYSRRKEGKEIVKGLHFEVDGKFVRKMNGCVCVFGSATTMQTKRSFNMFEYSAAGDDTELGGG